MCECTRAAIFVEGGQTSRTRWVEKRFLDNYRGLSPLGLPALSFPTHDGRLRVLLQADCSNTRYQAPTVYHHQVTIKLKIIPGKPWVNIKWRWPAGRSREQLYRYTGTYVRTSLFHFFTRGIRGYSDHLAKARLHKTKNMNRYQVWKKKERKVLGIVSKNRTFDTYPFISKYAPFYWIFSV